MDTRRWINELSVETGFIPAFAIGLPVVVWGYASYKAALEKARCQPGGKSIMKAK